MTFPIEKDYKKQYYSPYTPKQHTYQFQCDVAVYQLLFQPNRLFLLHISLAIYFLFSCTARSETLLRSQDSSAKVFQPFFMFMFLCFCVSKMYYLSCSIRTPFLFHLLSSALSHSSPATVNTLHF